MSDWMTRSTNRSRLGQILIEKKLISQDQLDAAIRAQEQSGRRLGEILADMKLITQAQVRGAVRRQRSLRMAAALATALLGPLHAYAAVAAAPAAASAACVWRRHSRRRCSAPCTPTRRWRRRRRRLCPRALVGSAKANSGGGCGRFPTPNWAR